MLRKPCSRLSSSNPLTSSPTGDPDPRAASLSTHLLLLLNPDNSPSGNFRRKTALLRRTWEAVGPVLSQSRPWLCPSEDMPSTTCRQRGGRFFRFSSVLFPNSFFWPAPLPLQRFKCHREEIILCKNNFKKHLSANGACLCKGSVPGWGWWWYTSAGLLIFRAKT